MTQAKVTDVKSVAVGQMTTFVLTSTGSIFGTGSNVYGELGLNEDSDIDDEEEIKDDKPFSRGFVEIPFFLSRKIQIVEIASGDEHVFARSSQDKLYGWGRNDSG